MDADILDFFSIISSLRSILFFLEFQQLTFSFVVFFLFCFYGLVCFFVSNGDDKSSFIFNNVINPIYFRRIQKQTFRCESLYEYTGIQTSELSVSSQYFQQMNDKNEGQNAHEKGNMFSNFHQVCKCDRCGKEFISDLELKLHKKVIHGEGEPLKNGNNFNQTDSSSDDDIKQQYPVKKSVIDKKINLPKKEIKRTPSSIKKEDSEANKNQEFQLSNISSNITEDLNKKIFLCGCAHKIFENTEDLTLHIKKQHSGFPPDGSMFGVCKKIVLKHFKPAEQTIPAFLYKNTPITRNCNFMCGCGLTYSCSTSLSHHIKKNHNGIQPEGTIGGSLGLSNQLTQNDSALRCNACQQKCDKNNHWVCDNCKDWKLCGNCELGEASKEWHEKEGHKIHMNN